MRAIYFGMLFVTSIFILLFGSLQKSHAAFQQLKQHGFSNVNKVFYDNNLRTYRIEVRSPDSESNRDLRSFYVYLPKCYENQKLHYAMIALHGGKGDGFGMMSKSDINSFSDDYCFIPIYAETRSYTRFQNYPARTHVDDEEWEDGRVESIDLSNDLEYLNTIIESIILNFKVSKDHIAMIGISSGSMMTRRYVCEGNYQLMTAGHVAGNFSETLMSNCPYPKRTPAIAFHGTEDAFQPYKTGYPTTPLISDPNNLIIGAFDSALFVAGKNGCEEEFSGSSRLEDKLDDGTKIFIDYATTNCGSHPSVLFTVRGGGHTWPGGHIDPSMVGVVGVTSLEISATREFIHFAMDPAAYLRFLSRNKRTPKWPKDFID